MDNLNVYFITFLTILLISGRVYLKFIHGKYKRLLMENIGLFPAFEN